MRAWSGRGEGRSGAHCTRATHDPRAKTSGLPRLTSLTATRSLALRTVLHRATRTGREEKCRKEVTLAYRHPSRRRKQARSTSGARVLPSRQNHGRAANTAHSAVRRCDDCVTLAFACDAGLPWENTRSRLCALCFDRNEKWVRGALRRFRVAPTVDARPTH